MSKELLIQSINDALDALVDESADPGDRIWEATQILETAVEEAYE